MFFSDFLVRESAKEVDSLVLSVFVSKSKGVKHFKITMDETNKKMPYSFEGDSFATVPELIDYHLKGGHILTQKSQAVITRGVERLQVIDCRNIHLSCLAAVYCQHASHPTCILTQTPPHTSTVTQRPFTAEDVTLGEKLGKGNFGDVMKGVIHSMGGQVCAVKTCRDTVTDPERFLEEADTLAQYQHPNIVILYGVVKRAPIMILLELCLGGELLQFLRAKNDSIDVRNYLCLLMSVYPCCVFSSLRGGLRHVTLCG